jgi:hypothetical protein
VGVRSASPVAVKTLMKREPQKKELCSSRYAKNLHYYQFGHRKQTGGNR